VHRASLTQLGRFPLGLSTGPVGGASNDQNSGSAAATTGEVRVGGDLWSSDAPGAAYGG
jgi:hypothetical protein